MIEKSQNFPVKFVEISFTTQELRTLNENEQNFLISSSFITNDIRYFWRLGLYSKTDGRDDLKRMQFARYLWVLRKLSSTIHEAENTWNIFVSKFKNEPYFKNEIEFKTKYARNKKYEDVASEFRNKTSNHFDPEILNEYLEYLQPDEKHIYFSHLQQGNSISTIGEGTYSYYKILNAFSGASINDFEDWCVKCSGSILSRFDTLTAELLMYRFPDRVFHEKEIDVASEIADAKSRWPLFFIQ